MAAIGQQIRKRATRLQTILDGIGAVLDRLREVSLLEVSNHRLTLGHSVGGRRRRRLNVTGDLADNIVAGHLLHITRNRTRLFDRTRNITLFQILNRRLRVMRRVDAGTDGALDVAGERFAVLQCGANVTALQVVDELDGVSRNGWQIASRRTGTTATTRGRCAAAARRGGRITTTRRLRVVCKARETCQSYMIDTAALHTGMAVQTKHTNQTRDKDAPHRHCRHQRRHQAGHRHRQAPA